MHWCFPFDLVCEPRLVHDNNEEEKPDEKVRDKHEEPVPAALTDAHESLRRPFLKVREQRGKEVIDPGDGTTDPCREGCELAAVFAARRRR
jgi:hypothetical protein